MGQRNLALQSKPHVEHPLALGIYNHANQHPNLEAFSPEPLEEIPSSINCPPQPQQKKEIAKQKAIPCLDTYTAYSDSISPKLEANNAVVGDQNLFAYDPYRFSYNHVCVKTYYRSGQLETVYVERKTTPQTYDKKLKFSWNNYQESFERLAKSKPKTLISLEFTSECLNDNQPRRTSHPIYFGQPYTGESFSHIVFQQMAGYNGHTETMVAKSDRYLEKPMATLLVMSPHELWIDNAPMIVEIDDPTIARFVKPDDPTKIWGGYAWKDIQWSGEGRIDNGDQKPISIEFLNGLPTPIEIALREKNRLEKMRIAAAEKLAKENEEAENRTRDFQEKMKQLKRSQITRKNNNTKTRAADLTS